MKRLSSARCTVCTGKLVRLTLLYAVTSFWKLQNVFFQAQPFQNLTDIFAKPIIIYRHIIIIMDTLAAPKESARLGSSRFNEKKAMLVNLILQKFLAN